MNDIFDDHVDVIIGNEFVEHLTDSQRRVFWKAGYNTLKKGGIICMHTHNTDNPSILRSTKDHWEQMETNYLRAKRSRIIIDEFPSLSEQEVAALVKATYGKNKKEILKLAQIYTKTKELPVPDYNNCAMEPDLGIPEENLISPKAVFHEMKEAGFVSYIYPWFGFSSMGRSLFSYGYRIPFFLIKSIVKSVSFHGIKS
jgi:hypothetical protein